jgi:hypothetical protein
MTELNWTCPVCQRDQTVSNGKKHFGSYELFVGENKHGRLGFTVYALGCSNSACKDVSLTVVIATDPLANGAFEPKETVSIHRLRPSSNAKVQPGYVPIVLVRDYQEACEIRDLSPKASATLARR